MKNPIVPKNTIQEIGVIQGTENFKTICKNTKNKDVRKITDSNPIAILFVFCTFPAILTLKTPFLV